MTIQNGDTVKDKITGFQGVVTGLCQYITGCNQCLVQPLMDSKGDFVESRWLDEQRLDVVESVAKIALENGATPGCDKAAPRR